MELGLLLDMAVEDDPGRLAITDTARRSFDRAELRRAAQSAASCFVSRKATHVAYLAGNGFGLPVSLFGAALAGVPFVPLNYRLSDGQLVELLARIPGCIVVASPEASSRLAETRSDQAVTPDDLISAATPEPGAEGDEPALRQADTDDVAVVLYTSGTSSEPKAALLRHRHLTSYVIGTVEFASAEASEAVIVSVPPYHVAGISAVLTNLYSGRRIVYLDPFDPGRWLDLVRDQLVSHAMVVPTMLARVVDHLDGKPADVPSLRSIAYGGAKMPVPVLERALSSFPDVGFANAYGLTETSSTIAVLGPDDHREAFSSCDPSVRGRLASAGRAIPGIELRVVDESGRTCDPDVSGSLLVRGDQVSGEYEAGSVLDSDGWFATNDRARIDRDGYLFIEGRSDEIIIRGGENIAPAEIEAVLLVHPAVQEAAVVGLEDEEWGQRIAAAVVLRSGASAEPSELQDWVRARLRSSRTPDAIEIREELPYTATGKLIRRMVRSSFD